MNNNQEQAIKDILACEKDRCEALAAEDVTTLRRLLAENLTHNHATGKVDNLESYLEYITTGIKFFDVSRTDDLEVKMISDDQATMSGTLINMAMMRANPGEPKRIESTAVQEWKKNGDQWQVVTFHAKRKS